MNPSINKWIIAAGVLLVILIIVTLIVGRTIQNSQSGNQPTLVPTGFFESGGDLRVLSDQERRELERRTEETNNNVLSLDQANRLEEFKTRLPVIDDDFELGYSEALGQFFILKKSANADSELESFFRDNNFLDVFREFPSLFVYSTNLPVDQAIANAEGELAIEKEEFYQLQLQQQSSQQSDQRTRRQRTTGENQFLNLMRTFFSIDTGNDIDELNSYLGITPTTQPSSTGGGGSGGSGGTSGGGNNNLCEGTGLRCRPDCLDGETQENSLSCSGPNRVCCRAASTSGGSDGAFTDRKISTALMAIFMEAGNAVNIAPKLLAAIMSRECAADVLYQPQSWILANPVLQPGHFCYGNSAGAQGPMQFMPDTWRGWAPRVKDILNLSGPANVQNIRHAVYGAAFKLKAAAQAQDPFNLTQQEVLRAANGYNPAGCPSYCQDVWTYYNNH